MTPRWSTRYSIRRADTVPMDADSEDDDDDRIDDRLDRIVNFLATYLP